MLDAAVAIEIEDRLFAENGGIEIAVRNMSFSSPSLCASATISPSGLTITLPAIIG